MIKLWIVGFIFYIIEGSVIREIAIANIIPSIILPLIIYVSLFHIKYGIWFGFIFGLLLDIHSKLFGLNALLLLLLSKFVSILSKKVYVEKVLVWLIFIFFFSLFYSVITFIFHSNFSFHYFLRYCLFDALYTTGIGIIIFYIFILCRL